MNCSKCGRPLDPGAVFCGNCGQPVGTVPQAPAQPVPPAAPITPATPPQNPAGFGQPVSPAPMSGQTAAPQPPQPMAAAPQPMPGVGMPPVPVAPVAVGGMPAYAAATGQGHPGETKAIIGLVLGILSIPGAFVPIVALVLGIAGVVIASLSLRLRRGLAILTFIFAGIGIILGILAWIYNIQHLDPQKHLSKETQTVATECYTVKLSSSLHVTNSNSGCETSGYDGSSEVTSTLAYHIEGSSEPALNSSNLDKAAEKAASTIVNSLNNSKRTYKLDSQRSGTFDGEQAHYYDVSAPDGANGEIALVLHSAANGDNVFEVDAFAVKGKIDLSALASNWEWK